jgi:hypothetical protein
MEAAAWHIRTKKCGDPSLNYSPRLPVTPR